MIPSFEELLTAEFGFDDIWNLIFKVYTHPHIDGFIQPVRGFIESLSPFAWGALLCLVALVFTFFGKKLIMIPVLFGSYAVAYAVGSTYIVPTLANFVAGLPLPFDVPVEIGFVGIACGVVAAVLCVPCYFALLVLGSGYTVHMVAYPLVCAILGEGTGLIVSLGAALAVAVLVIIFRKWVEMGATAIVGAYFFMLGVNEIILLPFIVNCIIWFSVAVAGAVVQIKTRKRY